MRWRRGLNVIGREQRVERRLGKRTEHVDLHNQNDGWCIMWRSSTRNTVKLRRQKKVSSQWPPRWSGPHEQGEKLPMGENGVTFKAATLMKNHIHLSVQFGNKEWVGVIESKDKEFLKRVYELLRNCEGQSLKQIGDLEIEET